MSLLVSLSGVVVAFASGVYAAEVAESDRDHMLALGIFLLGVAATLIGIVIAFN